jgi:acyl-CoA synthetase (AMP-forming)/AMP-acid ligase II
VHSLLAITTPFALLSSYSTPSELVHALRLSKATRIFVQAKFFSLVLRAAKDVGLPDSHIYIMEGHVKGRRTFDEMIHQVRKGFTARLAVRPAGKDTLAYLVFSSGTSGLPKGGNISVVSCTDWIR